MSKFHITGLGSPAHDLNALFKWAGQWHVMHQGDGNWRHLVSADLATWRRLPDALSGGGAWDGALTVLQGTGPVILFDCGFLASCLPPGGVLPAPAPAPGRRPLGVGDPPIVGVARPADLGGDRLLVNWTKDSFNPIRIVNSAAAYSGPSNLWQSAPPAGASSSGEHYYWMKMIQMNTSGWTTGLFAKSRCWFR